MISWTKPFAEKFRGDVHVQEWLLEYCILEDFDVKIIFLICAVA